MRDRLEEVYGEDEILLFADGLDDAIVGICGISYRVIYSVEQVIEMLMLQGMDRDDAIEYGEFKIFSSYVGEKTPIWMEN